MALAPISLDLIEPLQIFEKATTNIHEKFTMTA